jgi:hypothetical protein
MRNSLNHNGSKREIDGEKFGKEEISRIISESHDILMMSITRKTADKQRILNNKPPS